MKARLLGDIVHLVRVRGRVGVGVRVRVGVGVGAERVGVEGRRRGKG